MAVTGIIFRDLSINNTCGKKQKTKNNIFHKEKIYYVKLYKIIYNLSLDFINLNREKTMKTLLKIILSLCLVSGLSYGQEVKNKLYNPQADVKADISKAVAMADSTAKHVFIQIGGNWCKWCIRFNKFCKEDHEINSLMQSSYVVVHLNYSPENKNLEILKTLDYPQRFGFPVLVILDNKGKRIHTQDTALLESGDGYDRKKVMNFLKNWSPFALNLKNFEK